MSVLKDVTMKFKDFEEAEVWVALLKTGVCFNSLNHIYDGFYYKSDVIIQNMDGDKLRVCLRGTKEAIFRFGSQTSKEEFYRQLVG
ncbi:hypothetical protein BDFB_013142 [Asbolus verrucosus]|uniref:Uncharacterized protein n=1 Tax=Asbolus verrucosus TaxID=1661398 RepID=A0A482W8D3_ASBVE|nr:hypothetical protein BDFB_013142 [Asbolus verrucosus]